MYKYILKKTYKRKYFHTHNSRIQNKYETLETCGKIILINNNATFFLQSKFILKISSLELKKIKISSIISFIVSRIMCKKCLKKENQNTYILEYAT